MIDKALLKLRPNAQWDLNGDEYEGIVWKDTEQTIPTKEEVEAKILELKAEINANEYKEKRAMAYKPLAEQLDMMYWDKVHGTTTWQDHIDQVKADNPKPTE